MLVSGRMNCAVQFCTALRCQAVPIWPDQYANFCMQLPYGPAHTYLLEFAHLSLRSLNQPPAPPACRNWAFARLQTRLTTTGVRFQFCKFALRRRAGAPGIYPLHSCANLLQFLSGLAKSAFLLRKPPFCYNDKKKFDADISFSTISNVFDRKILLAVSDIGDVLVISRHQMCTFSLWIVSENKFEAEIFSKLSNFRERTRFYKLLFFHHFGGI